LIGETFGKLTHEPDLKRWAVTAEPQVVTRLKRTFPSVSQYGQGIHYVKDTPTNSRDLQWFMERYPLDVGADDLAHLTAQSTVHKDKEARARVLQRPDYVPNIAPLALPARSYQLLAADTWIANGGLLLADDLGVGKTLSIIAALTDPRLLPALIVCPTHMPKQWADEIAKFAPHLRTHIIRETTPYDVTHKPYSRNGAKIPLPDVFIVNYHKLHGWTEELIKQYGIQSVGYDEAQELRSGSSSWCQAAYYLAEHLPYRIGASATPINNYGEEYFNVLKALVPEALGTEEEFRREWCAHRMIRDPETFGSYLRREGLMLRRTRKEVGRELPPVTKVVYPIEVDLNALKEVESRSAELARFILSSGGRGIEKMKAGAELDWRLRQATGIAKAPYVAEFAKMLLESGEKIVIFGYHKAFYAILRDKLAKYSPAFYTGDQSTVQKNESKRRFIAGETDVLIMSLRSGAGLDGLQYSGCRTVVIGEYDWSPAPLDQGIARVDRDGQPDPVTAYLLMANDGSDPVIADVLGIKRTQQEGIRDPGGIGDVTNKSQVNHERMLTMARDLLARTNPAALAAIDAGKGLAVLSEAPMDEPAGLVEQ
jgi:SNF2 family DNA or RNA helicase